MSAGIISVSVSVRTSSERISSIVSLSWAIVSSIDSSIACRGVLRFIPADSVSTSSEWQP